MNDYIAPARCALMNADTGERLECQFNPAQLKERYKVKWAHLPPVGAPHEVMHYTGTENPRWSMDFHLDAAGTGFDIAHFRKFLIAFTKPARIQSQACPPAMIFVWPEFVTLTVRLLELEFTFAEFASNGAPVLYTAATQLETLEAQNA